jgi:type I site-specific restriction-modification system R (restriction) subunit
VLERAVHGQLRGAWEGFNQLQTYQRALLELFSPNVLLVISDGIQARLGSLGAHRDGASSSPTFRRSPLNQEITTCLLP